MGGGANKNRFCLLFWVGERHEISIGLENVNRFSLVGGWGSLTPLHLFGTAITREIFWPEFIPVV